MNCSLFKSGFQEASTSEVVIDDIDQEGFVVLLQYLYPTFVSFHLIIKWHE